VVRVAPRIIGPRGVIVGSRGFYRPYYSFRPRLSLGFGLWVGYPVAYPYYYGYPDYGYGYPYPYGYPDPYGYPASSYPGYGGYPPAPNGAYPPTSYGGYPPASNGGYPPSSSSYPAQPQTSVGAQPGQASGGGVSFEITPGTAEVYVDGAYVGTASTFGPSSQPLSLTPGRHRVEVRAPGYETMSFDADAIPGQVIPYQGAMQRNR
jgi:hypothetical protein